VKYLPIKNWITSFPLNTATVLLFDRKNSAKRLQQKISFLAYDFADTRLFLN
jgi:hypothetical protein